MALENLTPSNRLEAILDGGDVTPSNRKEYFIQKAMSAGGGSDLPEYTAADKGKVLTIGEEGELEWSFNQGGGGDFSTASVTIVNATTKNLTVGEYPPYIEDEEYISYGDEISVNRNSRVSFTAVLYKGSAGLQFKEGMTFTTSGSVEIDEYDYASISGDCTITITAAA